ncbi:hypothetical protein [Pseudobacteroides cellulosolvens]|uniref:Uncharacterized protein n=1 Tax=Pseudobacteroides cellulosolvens ATCC 35603 = DSM 2933 TaxID=398512 RepID=A0A0L6JGF5_9FIRM|nr:hypothetical protein [Pseudobacteroides cellulosolvens]KNY24770.1 hypothetical protein Bccel_0027 [Pseudobacteroides cellulosolvens ATCC 35603 = DSM 2933]
MAEEQKITIISVKYKDDEDARQRFMDFIIDFLLKDKSEEKESGSKEPGDET